MVLLSSIVSYFLIFFIKLYQYCISPFILSRCRFYPTCSEYTILSLRNYYFFYSIKLIIIRLLKCHPYNLGGYDPLPNQIKDKSEY